MKVQLTPTHQVDLSPEFSEFVQEAPRQDITIRSLARKIANGQPLMQADLVIAGEQARTAFPLARTYPVHFRKTYFPSAFHPHPELEYAKLQRASEILQLPPPIGYSATEFRSCFIPGQAFSKLTPFGVQPPLANVKIAREVQPVALIGLWKLLELLYDQVERLDQAGMWLGDLVLQSVVVPHAPVGVVLIDFEQAQFQDGLSQEDWETRCWQDTEELLRHALFVQCGLGYQVGTLADASHTALEKLTNGDASSFVRAMDHA